MALAFLVQLRLHGGAMFALQWWPILITGVLFASAFCLEPQLPPGLLTDEVCSKQHVFLRKRPSDLALKTAALISFGLSPVWVWRVVAGCFAGCNVRNGSAFRIASAGAVRLRRRNAAVCAQVVFCRACIALFCLGAGVFGDAWRNTLLDRAVPNVPTELADGFPDAGIPVYVAVPQLDWQCHHLACLGDAGRSSHSFFSAPSSF